MYKNFFIVHICVIFSEKNIKMCMCFDKIQINVCMHWIKMCAEGKVS